MKRIFKSTVSILLVISTLLGSVVAVSAKSEEVYISELRLIYADSYNEAKESLANTSFADYQLLNENLNSGSGEVGVWLAYKTSTNIDDAITDIAVMQMGGAYSDGNYRELIKSVSNEYFEMGEIYLQAVEYFMYAYDSGDFLASSAHRQLNFYNGLDLYPDDRLGDLFVDAVLDASDLATLFLQGNSYALKNIRSLLAMGVSYNDDGMHYLEKVSESAEAMDSDRSIFDGEDYDGLASVIASSITVFGGMFDELSAYEAELNYSDDDLTDLEIRYSEYKALAEMLRAVKYIDGKSLYEFCVGYEPDPEDYSSLYPLVDALNEGQTAMASVLCYYDVVRYSMTELPKEIINSELETLEQTYGEAPVDVYTGVDRSIYEETFALTSNASRADSYYDTNTLADALFGDAWMMKAASVQSSALDVGMSVWSIQISDAVAAGEAAEKMSKTVARYTNMVRQVTNAIGGLEAGIGPFADTLIKKYTFYDLVYDLLYNYDKNLPDPEWTFNRLLDCFKHEVIAGGMFRSEEAKILLKLISSKVEAAESAVVQSAPDVSTLATSISAKFTTLFYFFDAAILLSSAISLGIKVYDHYNPVYDAVPTAMVDLINTEDGDDVYVKYNVVYEAKAKKDGEYGAGDLNAFEGRRWNALYYTKNIDAGKPLLADFEVSSASNRADDGYIAVHRFGEVVCYDLNKYNFSDESDNVFLSVAQSQKSKISASADTPNVVGSIFGNGFVFLAGGIGIVLGVCGALGVQFLLKKNKKKENEEEQTG